MTTLIDRLLQHASERPDETIYQYLHDDGHTEKLTYQDLQRRVDAISLVLLSHAQPGDRALLLYPDGLAFIQAFLACLRAGIIAVPANLPRNNHNIERLESILDDCEPKLVLTEAAAKEIVTGCFDHAAQNNPRAVSMPPLIATDEDTAPTNSAVNIPAIESNDLAFLQYTSGSTGDPKGVMVSHGNLIANSQGLQVASRHDQNSVMVSWLPAFHDMGLIMGLLQPLYVGFLCVSMAPVTFIQKPIRWLKAISDYRATTSVAPNFAYQFCIDRLSAEDIAPLDLSCWKVAANGAEAIRADTLSAFAEMFSICGFDANALATAYGMAETTLLLTCSNSDVSPPVQYLDKETLRRHSVAKSVEPSPSSRALVSCGKAHQGHGLLIVNTQTNTPCDERVVGEIWVQGPSITQGYWRRPELTATTFQAFTKDSKGPFLRTGDMGFIADGELYITGRLKEMIIIRGQNYYPQDIEWTVSHSSIALNQHAGAAFAVERNGKDALVVVQEIRRKWLAKFDQNEVFNAIRVAIAEAHQIKVDTIVLIKPGHMPKTSSGKIQYRRCRDWFLADQLDPLAQWESDDVELPRTGTDEPIEQPAATLNAQQIQKWLQQQLASHLNRTPDDIPLDMPFKQLGLDSAKSVEFSGLISEWLGTPMPANLLYDHPSINELTRYLSGKTDSVELLDANAPFNEPIAIIGMACRLPGNVRTPEEFWQLLHEGKDGIEPVPNERWDADAIYHPEPDHVGTSYCKHGGFIHDIDRFDAGFFGISGREAQALDPQQRILLELSWEAMESAGLIPKMLHNSKTGVFIGHSGSDYPLLNSYNMDADGYQLTGELPSTSAGRISFMFGFKGPSYAVDTACSSSLSSLHLACQSLHSGESRLALAGGVSVQTTPKTAVEMSRLHASSPDGRCKAFSETADGAGWSDGAGMLVLKRLSEAQKDGDPILAVIRGSAINQDGRSAGLTTPNGPSQRNVILQALANASLKPDDIDYIEAHGTGTKLGDPIEANALEEVFSNNTQPILLGSAKSNVGHTMAAAGVTGVIKTVLSLQNKTLPKTLHTENPSTRIDWASNHLTLVAQNTPWSSEGKRPRRAGISSFGISGTNAHVILEEPPVDTIEHIAPPQSVLLPLSAKTPQAIADYANNLASYIDSHPNVKLVDLASHLARYRSELETRAVVVAENLEQARTRLLALANDEQNEWVIPIEATEIGVLPKTVFVFPGQGSQWLGMGQELLATDQVFANTIDECEKALSPYVPWSLKAVLQGVDTEHSLDDVSVVQPVLFAVFVALARLWQSLGVNPDAVIGHSQGEVAAAHIVGILSLEDAVKISALRSQAVKQLVADSDLAYGMTLVKQSVEDLQSMLNDLGGKLNIAVINAPKEVAVSGPVDALNKLEQRLEEKQVFWRRIPVDYASHSPQIDTLENRLHSAFADIESSEPQIEFYSTAKASRINSALSPTYWQTNLRQPVQFMPTVEQMLHDGFTHFIEISSHPVLTTALAEIIEIHASDNPSHVSPVVVSSLQRERYGRKQLLLHLGELWVKGYQLDRDKLYPKGNRLNNLPGYPFQRQRYWLDSTSARPGVEQASTNMNLLGCHQTLADGTDSFTAGISSRLLPWANDHQVLDYCLLPGVALFSQCQSALDYLNISEQWHLADLEIMVPFVVADEEHLCQLLIHPEDETSSRTIELYRKAGENRSGWHLQFKARVTRGIADFPSSKPELPPAGTPLDTKDIYSTFSHQGIDYGPVFQGLTDAWQLDGGIWAKVQIPDSVSIEGYGLHPTLLDAALHSLALHPGTQIDSRNDSFYLPVGADAFYCTPNPAPLSALWVHCETMNDDHSELVNADIRLFDNKGNAVAYLQGFQARLTEAGTLEQVLAAQGQTSEDESQLFTLQWQDIQSHPSPSNSGHQKFLNADQVSTEQIFEELATLNNNDALIFSWLSPQALDGMIAQQQKALTILQQLAVLSEDQTKNEQLPHLVWLIQNDQQDFDWILGGLAGLARSACNEYNHLNIQLLTSDGVEDHSKTATIENLKLEPDETNWRFKDGKLQVLRLHPESPTHAKNPIFRHDGTVLITGGLGSLGKHAARWLVETQGIRHLLLASRRGIKTSGAEDFVKELQDLTKEEPLTVEIVTCDVTDYAELTNLFNTIPKNRPLRAIFHTAGALADGLLADLSPESMADVFDAKVIGAWHLHKLCIEYQLDLDAFVLYSSAAGVMGNPGQANYAAANQCLDALAETRHAKGLPATSIAWGYWSTEDSVMTGNFQQSYISRFEQQGFLSVGEASGRELLKQSLLAKEPTLVAMPLKRRRLRQTYSDHVPCLFRDIIQSTHPNSDNGDLLENLQQLPEEERLNAVVDFVHEQVASVLALPQTQVSTTRSLKELGMDSLLAVQIRNRLVSRTGVKLNAGVLFDHGTVQALATHLLELLPAADANQSAQGIITGDAPLAPMQQWLLSYNPVDAQYINQSVFIEIPHDVDPELLKQAFAAVLEHHDALRLCFTGTKPNEYRQYNQDLSDTLPFNLIDLSEASPESQEQTIQQIADHYQHRLDIHKGPIAQATLFNFGPDENMRMSIIVHQLAIDHTSWQWLLADLHSAWQQLASAQNVQLPAKTQAWIDWANTLALQPKVQEDDKLLQRSPYLCPVPHDVTESDVQNPVTCVYSINLPDMEAANQAYHTHTQDLLFAALAITFKPVIEQTSLLIDVEFFGRGELDLDASRTLGCFSYLHPVLIQMSENRDTGDVIKRVKEQLRTIAHSGVESERKNTPASQISFHFHDALSPWLQDTGWALITGSGEVKHSPEFYGGHEINIRITRSDTGLEICWHYNPALHRPQTITAIAERHTRSIQALISHCENDTPTVYTPSDFPDIKVTQSELDHILERLGVQNIAALYPLLPTQYMLHPTWGENVTHTFIYRFNDELYDKSDFYAVLDEMSEQYELLRSRYIEFDDKVIMAIRPTFKIDIETIVTEDPNILTLYQTLHLPVPTLPAINLAEEGPLRVTLIKQQDKAYIWFAFDHIVYDSFSISLFFTDFFTRLANRKQASSSDNMIDTPSRFAPLPIADLLASEADFFRYASDDLEFCREKLNTCTSYSTSGKTSTTHFITLDNTTYQQIIQYSEKTNTPIKHIVQSAFSWILHAICKTEKVCYWELVNIAPDLILDDKGYFAPMVNRVLAYSEMTKDIANFEEYCQKNLQHMFDCKRFQNIPFKQLANENKLIPLLIYDDQEFIDYADLINQRANTDFRWAQTHQTVMLDRLFLRCVKRTDCLIFVLRSDFGISEETFMRMFSETIAQTTNTAP